MARTAFVTGGTGFIGTNLIELLVDEGWKVTALHRPTSDLTYLKRFPIALVEGCLTDRSALDRAIPDGTEVVFHLAGDTSFWSRNDARQDATNVEGTRNAVEASAAKGVRVFVHTSSISAWGRVTGAVNEETHMRGKDSWINYERSKHLGEMEAMKGVDRGMRVVVLSPGDVVGPYDARSWGRLFFLLQDGAVPVMGPGTVHVSHVRDVVEAHLAAVEKGRNGERYLLAGEQKRLVELAGAMAALSGANVPHVAPAWVLKLYGHLSVMLAALTGKEPDVTPEIAQLFSDEDVAFSSSKAIAELGFHVRPMSEAVRDNYDWLIKEGLL